MHLTRPLYAGGMIYVEVNGRIELETDNGEHVPL